MSFLAGFICLILTNAFGQSSVEVMLSKIAKANQVGVQSCGKFTGPKHDCQFIDSEKKYSIQSLQSREDLLAKIRNSSVIYIGESHEEDSSQFYSWILQNSKFANKRSCLNLEIDHDSKEETLQKCNADPATSFKLNTEIQSRFEISCPGGKESIGVPGWRNIAIEAFKLGWEVHAVDERSKCSNEVTLDSVACRNKYMAERVSDLMQKGCERTVSIFGRLHLVSDPKLKSPGIEKLVTYKPGSKTLLLELDSQVDFAKSVSILRDCGYENQKFMIFSTKGLETGVYSGIGNFGSESQFDFVILLPQKTK